MEEYKNRQFMIFDVSELTSIDFWTSNDEIK